MRAIVLIAIERDRQEAERRGFPKIVFMIDFERAQESMREIVSPYLRYRYVQRAVLRQGWLPARRQAFPLTIEQINGLCLPVGPRP